MQKIIIPIIGLLLVLFFLSSTKETDTKPAIYQILPDKGRVGDIITISGKNLGVKRSLSIIKIGNISCQDYDFDYVFWSDEKVQFRMPTGTTSGEVTIIVDGKESATGPVLTNENSFSHTYSNPMDMTVDYTLSFTPVKNTSEPLYVWMPSSIPGDNQRNVKLQSYSTNRLQTQVDELDLYKIEGMTKGSSYQVNKKFSFTNYQIETSINPDDVSDDYDTGSEFYTYYTSQEYGVECDNPQMKKLANDIVKNEKNPYIKSRLIYDWVVANLTYQYPPPNKDWRAIQALGTHRGDCAVYSFLFTALCRASGVPARPIAGHVLFTGDYISMHFWAEFYIPHYGWIPVDANYGDVQVKDFKDRSFYFGNLDNRHIAFSRGKTVCFMPDENGKTGKSFILRFLQKYQLYIKDQPVNSLVSVKSTLTRVF